MTVSSKNIFISNALGDIMASQTGENPIIEGKDLVEEVLLAVNLIRGKLNLPAVIDPLIDNLTDVYKSTIVIQDVFVSDKSDDEAVDEAIIKLNEVLALNESDSELSWVRNTLLNKAITHLDARIGGVDDENVLILDAYYRYVDVEPLGGIIDGDLVIQGSCLNPNYGPVLCIIEYDSNGVEKFTKALGIAPWNMIFTPPNRDESVATFSIPISLGLDYKRGSIRVSIYVDEIDKIPYKEEKKDFKVSSELYICAWEYVAHEDDDAPSTKDADILDSIVNETDQYPRKLSKFMSSPLGSIGVNDDSEYLDVPLPSKPLPIPDVITDIRVVKDYDDVQALKSEGYDLNCIELTPDGIQQNQEFLWKFYVMVTYQPFNPNVEAVEDIKWHRCIRTKGDDVYELPGYDIIKQDLADKSSEYSVYLAVKYGKRKRIRSLAMLSTSVEDDSKLHEFIDNQEGRFEQAPIEISRHMGNHSVGILLEFVNDIEVRQLTRQIANSKEIVVDQDEIDIDVRNKADDDMLDKILQEKRVEDLKPLTEKDNQDDTHQDQDAMQGNEVGSDNEDDDKEEIKSHRTHYSTLNSGRGSKEVESLEFLQQRYDSALEEYDKLINSNYELQKKAAIYIAKEKLKQNQAQMTINKSAYELAMQTFLESETLKDVMLEKQKQYELTMKSLAEINVKLIKQEDEYTQIATDLQTRLDDKEFKAMEIANSFKAFKHEILQKAVNSRSGMGISKRLIRSFELAESKRDEELEKVRLRNISLRTTLKKLERVLRAKEQLAEGLHMMDFEQLKIENQTLNEKIEERNEELAKLKRKKTFTVQVLTHIREKLRYYHTVNGGLAKELKDVDEEIMSIRSIVNDNKHMRDETKSMNKELKQKQGFATNALLVQDFENRKHTVEHMKLAIKDCQEQYSILLDQLSLEQGNSHKFESSSAERRLVANSAVKGQLMGSKLRKQSSSRSQIDDNPLLTSSIQPQSMNLNSRKSQSFKGFDPAV